MPGTSLLLESIYNQCNGSPGCLLLQARSVRRSSCSKAFTAIARPAARQQQLRLQATAEVILMCLKVAQTDRSGSTVLWPVTSPPGRRQLRTAIYMRHAHAQ
jgi:hypothetical protein